MTEQELDECARRGWHTGETHWSTTEQGDTIRRWTCCDEIDIVL